MKTDFLFQKLFSLSLSLAVPLVSFAQDEFLESLPDGTRPVAVTGATDFESTFAGATRQSDGALSGRIVFTAGGHGWTWGRNGWFTQRGVSHEMNEDYGNLDQMNFFVPYVFNAGATVIAFRPIGYQTNEVVLDNDSSDVKFSGKWFESGSEIFYGNEGDVPYRFATLDKAETATATYTPRIPEAGFYPVYTWARHGPDRTSQLYRILHTGGQTLVRVPHHMVGSGWVYLGTYFFNAGANRKNGSVIISNLQPSPGFGAVAVADAIRFGNGMGDVVPAEGAHVSAYPREEEASRYWVLKSLGQGQSNLISGISVDQQGSNVGAPPRMAREMNRERAGNMFKRIYIGFHSNAGGGRGTIGLWNDDKLFPGTKTPNQERLAELMGAEINDVFGAMTVPPLEVPWFTRTRLTYARNDYAFGEINNKAINDEFDATIIEVAFHDSKEDAILLRDPRVRDIAARCSYQAVVRYMNEFDEVPLNFLTEPPTNVRATSSGERISIAWDKPVDSGTNSLESFLVYRSENGYGFGNPTRVSATQTSVTLKDLPRGKDFYFHVTAVNAGGESLPSFVVGCRLETRKNSPRVLFVNGFTQFDRLNNPRQTPDRTNYVAPSALGKMDRVIPRLNNAFDYVVQHGNALAASGVPFDSCQREAVANGTIQLEKYEAVIWAAGKQRANLFTATEQQALARYLSHGGNVFLSGAYVAESLDSNGTESPSLHRELRVVRAGSPAVSVSEFSFAPAKASIFRRNQSGKLGGDGKQIYFVNEVSRLATNGSGAQESLLYGNESGIAAVQYDGSAGGGKAVCFGFPFESISSAKIRSACMGDVLRFFDFYSPRRQIIEPQIVRNGSGAQISWRTEPGRKYQVQFQSIAGGVLWQNLGNPVIASGLSLVQTDARKTTVGYRVIVAR